MKVKAIINFNDLEDKVSRKIGDVFECSEERTNFLLEHKAIEIVEEVKEKIPTIKNVDESLEQIHESAKEEVKLNELGNPVGTREIKPKKKKTSKK